MHLVLGGLFALQAVTSSWPLCKDHRTPPDDPAAADRLARQLAPSFTFGPGEHFFPTVPYFTAFDGDSLGGDPHKADFRDPWEVAPVLLGDATHRGDALHTSWDSLVSIYHHLSSTENDADHGAMEYALRRAVVLYRVCALDETQNRNVVRYLKSDEQAFERFELQQPLDTVLGAKPRFDVIQYFLYYLADQGLQGHPNDIELVSVFIPSDPVKQSQFRIIVGSGHSPRTPNNVLVLSAFHRGYNKLSDSSFVLVELGGHSSAPDVPPIGRFKAGLDANWHGYNLWGTRDVQAAMGTGFIGHYTQDMMFDRGPGSDGIVVFSPGYERFDTTAMKQKEQEITGKADSVGRRGTEPPVHQYRLLPMHALMRLDTALTDTNNVAEITEAVHDIQRRLCPTRPRRQSGCDAPDTATWASEDFATLDLATRKEAIRAMRLWKAAMVVNTTHSQFEARDRSWPGLPRIVEQMGPTARDEQPAAKHRPWEHQSFIGECTEGKECKGKADPTEVFKAHLFRPNSYTVAMDGKGVANLLVFGLTAAPTDGYEAYSGIVVPAFRTHGIPVRLGGFLELHAGINRAWSGPRYSPTFGMVLENHRNSVVGWYLAGSWVPRREQVTRNPDAGEFALGGGASLLPYISTHMFSVINAVRLRAGIRFDPLVGGDLFSRVRWEIHLALRQ